MEESDEEAGNLYGTCREIGEKNKAEMRREDRGKELP